MARVDLFRKTLKEVVGLPLVGDGVIVCSSRGRTWRYGVVVRPVGAKEMLPFVHRPVRCAERSASFA